MRNFAIGLFAATALGGAALTASGPAHAVVERLIENYADPGEFYLFDSADRELVSFKNERLVELCVGQNQHGTALEVSYDEMETVIEPGTCMYLEAKQITVSPEGELESGWDLRGRITPMDG